MYRLLIAGAVVAVLAAAASTVSAAQEAVAVTTPYPAVVVEAGESVVFDLSVTGPGRVRVNLAVTRKPKGWQTTIRGGGFVIDGVMTNPRGSPNVQLEVDVPAGAGAGTYPVTVTASSSAGSSSLDLSLRVARAAAGSVELAAEFDVLRGPSDSTFTFDLELENNTPKETSFGLEATGPPGWRVEARPAAETQAARIKVAGGSTGSIQVEVTPAENATAGSYPIGVRATGGGKSAQMELTVEITGNFVLTLTTPDERLSTDVVAGSSSEFILVVRNEGTAPLTGVQLSSTPPTDWRVEFAPEEIEVIEPGREAQVTARIVPSGEAVAGDYVLTMSASSAEANEQVDVRVTVKTSALWGSFGLLLILAALGGLMWVFRRYGRR